MHDQSVLGLISYGFNKITPHYHPFSLVDLSISYPFLGDTVTVRTLYLSTIIAPIIIIFLVVLLLVPGFSVGRTFPRGALLQRKLWELYAGWMGLALSLITQFLLVQGLKNAVGKPRPDMLQRCDPDLSDLARFSIGGYGQPITDRWVLVNQTICQQPDKAVLDDGFRSFPSGHAGSKSQSTSHIRPARRSRLAAPCNFRPLTPLQHPLRACYT